MLSWQTAHQVLEHSYCAYKEPIILENFRSHHGHFSSCQNGLLLLFLSLGRLGPCILARVTLSPLTVSSFLRALMGYGLSGACRDVSSVEVLMNYHQSLKSEVEARNTSVLQCIEMGKTLLAARNPASEEVTHKTASTTCSGTIVTLKSLQGPKHTLCMFNFTHCCNPKCVRPQLHFFFYSQFSFKNFKLTCL